jgi:hypothetical protein
MLDGARGASGESAPLPANNIEEMPIINVDKPQDAIEEEVRVEDIPF